MRPCTSAAPDRARGRNFRGLGRFARRADRLCDRFRADAVASAKRDLKAGEVLDGEGGYMVVGRLMPAADSLALGALPLGLAQQVKARQSVKAGRSCAGPTSPRRRGRGGRVRREMESIFAAPKQRAA